MGVDRRASNIPIRWDDWQVIADALPKPWSATAAEIDFELTRAAGGFMRPAQAAKRWGWRPVAAASFFDLLDRNPRPNPARNRDPWPDEA
jgi:hypothetical protein